MTRVAITGIGPVIAAILQAVDSLQLGGIAWQPLSGNWGVIGHSLPSLLLQISYFLPHRNTHSCCQERLERPMRPTTSLGTICPEWAPVRTGRKKENQSKGVPYDDIVSENQTFRSRA